MRSALVLAGCLFVFALSGCKNDDPPVGPGPNDDSGVLEDGGVGLDANVITMDADGDGLDDAWEVEHGLDPNRNDANEDFDGDGISNINEFTGGTLPDDIDTDDDGVGDGDEDANKNGTVDPGESSARLPDSDGDGLTDGQELGKVTPLTSPRAGVDGTDPALFLPDENPATTSNPTNPDTDGDGTPDGFEDLNHNGRIDVGETNPLDLDSDDDGIADGTEDANHNGVADPNETSATDADTDNDGIPDGVERGVVTPVVDPDGNGPLLGTDLARWRPDADPASTTDPLRPDSDGDGVLDGDEDWNHDGSFDPALELDPNNADTDGDGTPDANEGIAVVCSTNALRQVMLHSIASADVTLALPLEYSEVSVLREASGRGVGLMFRNPTSGVVGFAISKTPEGPDAPAESQINRNRINNAANLSNQQDRTLISWDGFPSVFTTASAQQGGINAVDLAADMARRVSQAGTLTGTLPSGGNNAGNFTVNFETILRPGRAIVVGAIADDPTSELNIIAMSDVANGTGVAQFGDFTGLGCDQFTSPPGNDTVDLLWIVDNSCSMEQEQNNVAAAGAEMVALLSTTQLSWRLGLMSTDPSTNGNIGCCGVNGFTPSSPRATAEAASQQWAQAVDQLGTGGSGEEQGATLGLTAINNLSPATAAEDPFKFRQNASVIIVHMSDEEDFTVKTAAGGNDQSCPENANKQSRIDALIAGYLAQAQPAGTAGLTTFAIHGIQPNASGADFCDFNTGSGDCVGASQHGRAYIDIAAAMGGGTGSICGDMSQVVQDIIRAGAGIASQISLTKPPISSTIRVVMADEANNFVGQPDVPRSRSNGFDYAFSLDVMNNRVEHKIVFYGTARPPANRQLMISYRTWEDGSPNPAGPDCDCPDGQLCNFDTNDCQIDPTCGGGCLDPANPVCNPDTGLCEEENPCGGPCDPGNTCNPDTGMCEPESPCGECAPGTFCNENAVPPRCEGL